MKNWRREKINPLEFIKANWPDFDCSHITYDAEAGRGMRYVVGPLLLATVFGMVDLKCGRYPGQRERVRIPVICEVVK